MVEEKYNKISPYKYQPKIPPWTPKRVIGVVIAYIFFGSIWMGIIILSQFGYKEPLDWDKVLNNSVVICTLFMLLLNPVFFLVIAPKIDKRIREKREKQNNPENNLENNQ